MKKQKIKYNDRGCYLTYYGRRIYLHNVMRANNAEEEISKLAKKYESNINDVAIGYYEYNYKIYILGNYNGDAIGIVEFISY